MQNMFLVCGIPEVPLLPLCGCHMLPVHHTNTEQHRVPCCLGHSPVSNNNNSNRRLSHAYASSSQAMSSGQRRSGILLRCQSTELVTPGPTDVINIGPDVVDEFLEVQQAALSRMSCMICAHAVRGCNK